MDYKDKKETKKALECAYYLCNEYPYQKYDDYDYHIRGIHKLVEDVRNELKGIDEYD